MVNVATLMRRFISYLQVAMQGPISSVFAIGHAGPRCSGLLASRSRTNSASAFVPALRCARDTSITSPLAARQQGGELFSVIGGTHAATRITAVDRPLAGADDHGRPQGLGTRRRSAVLDRPTTGTLSIGSAPFTAIITPCRDVVLQRF